MADKTESKTFTPTQLGEMLGVDPKQIRSYLRREFTRDLDAKNTSWVLTEDVAEVVIEHFSKPQVDEDLEIDDEG